ncbi:MAG: Serine-protein kinase RsbW [Firmicutes bacterium]|nr:Serine-protein kinase RsbW [Bacillota bacterium]MDI6706771.1 ATP-binding protein [Bacillota bacterium]
MDEIVLVLPNKPEYVSVARLTVSGIANRMGFDVEAIEDIKLALAEACTNAIKHGCCDEYKEYRVKFVIDETGLTVSIADKGCGVKEKDVKAPDLENPKEGGLGIFIIRTLMDEVDFEVLPDSGFNLTMKKYMGV